MADRALVFIDGNNWYHALAKSASLIVRVWTTGRSPRSCACPLSGAQLGRTVNAFIRLPRDWFDDLLSLTELPEPRTGVE